MIDSAKARTGLVTIAVWFGLIIAFIAFIVFGGAHWADQHLFVSNSAPAQVQPPMCDGQVMQPGDVCDVYINGVYRGTDTYDDRVKQAQDQANYLNSGIDTTLGTIFRWIVIVVAFIIAGWIVASFTRRLDGTLQRRSMMR